VLCERDSGMVCYVCEREWGVLAVSKRDEACSILENSL
jgi:hypothetical protein